MSFIPDDVYGRSTITNIKNQTWDVHPIFKVYEEEGRAIVAYVDSLNNKIKELEEKLNASIYQEKTTEDEQDESGVEALTE